MTVFSVKTLLIVSSVWATTSTGPAMADSCSNLGEFIAVGFLELGPENEPLTYMLNLFPDHSVNVLAIYSRALHERVYTTSVPTVLVIGNKEYVADNENGFSANATEITVEPVLSFRDGLSVELSKKEAHCFVGRLPEGVELTSLNESQPTLGMRDGRQLVFEGLTRR